MNTSSIRFRLISWYAGLLTGGFLLFGVALYSGLRHYLESDLRQTLERRGHQIAESLLTGVETTGWSYVRDEINARYAPAVYDRFIRITRADGRLVYASGKTQDATIDPALVPPLAAPVTRTAIRRETLPNQVDLLIITVAFDGGRGQRFFIEVGGLLQPIETILRRLLLSLEAGLPLVVLVAVGGGSFLVRRSLAPVVRAAGKAEQISLHNLNERLPLPATGDELERLALALNHMIARLQEAFDQNRRFLADASHELRTPLAALRGELETLLEEANPSRELRDRVGSALEEVDRLAKIVERLFAIARLDAGEAQGEWLKFDVARLTATTAEQMALLAEDKGVSVSCAAPTQVYVEGDQARVKQVVVNLLDNAIKYTPHGGTINLSVGAAGGKAVLEVADNGIGIPAEALPHLFERFYRVDKARSRDLGGAGLGLSIVRSICSAHGGQVEVKSQLGRGSRFRVELPLAPPGVEPTKQTHEH